MNKNPRASASRTAARDTGRSTAKKIPKTLAAKKSRAPQSTFTKSPRGDRSVNRSKDARKQEVPVPATVVPLPPSLVQITSLLTSIQKDVALLCLARPRSRDARLLASGISRAAEEIATRCRDYAGVEAESEGIAVVAAEAAPPVASVPAPALPPAPPAPPAAHVSKQAAAQTTPSPRVQPIVPPPVLPLSAAPGEEMSQQRSPAGVPAPSGQLNHALVLARPSESLHDVAARLGQGVSCSYIGRAAQVRHVDHKGFLSAGSRVIVVRDNGEVLGHLPWVDTAPGSGDQAKTYFLFANPTEAVPASGVLDLADLKLPVPIAIGPGVINRTLTETDAEGAARYREQRSALGNAAAAICGI